MSDIVRCLDCRCFSFDRAGAEWSRKGRGCCERRIAAMKFDPERERDCQHFNRAEARVVAKRVEWMAQVRRSLSAQEHERTRFLREVEHG